MKEYTHYTSALCLSLIIPQATGASIVETGQVVIGSLACCDIADLDQSIKWLRHRGFTHSIILPSIVGIIWLYALYNNQVGLYYNCMGAVIGLLTHILMDMLNGKGVELFWPVKRNFTFADVTYDGKLEKFIDVLFVAGIIITLVNIGTTNIIGMNVMEIVRMVLHEI